MHLNVLPLLKCPACGSPKLAIQVFSSINNDQVKDGVVWCTECKTWFPVEDGLLEFLLDDLVYKKDRENFISRFGNELRSLGLDIALPSIKKRDKSLQIKQQYHFDWYAHNAEQSYSEYENTPFWVAADRLAYEPWRMEIQKNTWLLDIGCAQGRSTFKLMDRDINILGMDVAKNLVRQAIERSRKRDCAAKATFITADANAVPVIDNAMDYILIYGVLHHLPDPKKTCSEVARILKPGGKYFGSENNTTLFRVFFDLLQRLIPAWSEEAGPEALISHKYMIDAFRNTSVIIQTRTSIYLPPHPSQG